MGDGIRRDDLGKVDHHPPPHPWEFPGYGAPSSHIRRLSVSHQKNVDPAGDGFFSRTGGRGLPCTLANLQQYHPKNLPRRIRTYLSATP